MDIEQLIADADAIYDHLTTAQTKHLDFIVRRSALGRAAEIGCRRLAGLMEDKEFHELIGRAARPDDRAREAMDDYRKHADWIGAFLQAEADILREAGMPERQAEALIGKMRGIMDGEPGADTESGEILELMGGLTSDVCRVARNLRELQQNLTPEIELIDRALTVIGGVGIIKLNFLLGEKSWGVSSTSMDRALAMIKLSLKRKK